ncbi:DUF6542 domain-containing protein [Streptomyces sp. NPDC005931]|uniref:DUF6542 domain-containing protein n=1 Tax=Streptomyces sp. NPDC005931 TaxID=3364737 RepID=UPI003680D10B
MEHYTKRPVPYAARRDKPSKPPLPPQAGRGAGGGVARPARPPGAAARSSRAPAGAGARSAVNTPARRRPAAERRGSAPPAVRRLPDPRLTGLGSGLFCTAVMFALGCLIALLFGASQTAYGVLFLPVCVLTAVWVRRGDLLTAPVVVPIAFAVGLVPVADGSEGTSGRLMGLVTGLATQAGWLYAGTLTTGAIVIVRRIRMISRRTARNRAQA